MAEPENFRLADPKPALEDKVNLRLWMRKAAAQRSWTLMLFILGAFALRLFAQQDSRPSLVPAPQEGNLVLKSSVNRVILDVVVTDSLGKPVHGLNQQDFSLAENGEQQKILSFDVHDLESATEFPKLPPLPPNTFVNVPNAPERGPLYVLLLDLVNTEADDEPYARQQLLKFVSGKPQGTRFAVFALSDGLHLVQGFTDDREKLYAILDPSRPRPHIPRIFLYQRNFGRGDGVMMLSVFDFISRFLDGLPGRKNLIWFSGSFPADFFPSDDDTTVAYRERLKQTLNIMAQGQIAIYPVDVRGVVTNPEGALTGANPKGGVGGEAAGTPPGAPPSNPQSSPMTATFRTAGRGGSTSTSYATQDSLAEMTGGRAFYSDNGIKDVLDLVVENGANYYTLTYSPSNRSYDGALRSIRVDLNKKGYRLSYRSSYYAYDPDTQVLDKDTFKQVMSGAQPPPPRKLGDSLYANMQHGAPLAHQLFFRAHVHTIGAPAMATLEQMGSLESQPAYFRVRHKNRPLKPLPPIKLQPYVIDYTFVAGSPKGATGHAIRPPMLEVAAAAFDEDGRMLNGMVDVSTSTDPVPPGQNPQGIYRVRQQLDVPLSATSIRIAVRDVSTDRIGAMEISLPLAPEIQSQATVPNPVPATGAPGKAN